MESELHLDTEVRAARRHSAGFGVSAVLHVAILLLVFVRSSPEYIVKVRAVKKGDGEKYSLASLSTAIYAPEGRTKQIQTRQVLTPVKTRAMAPRAGKGSRVEDTPQPAATDAGAPNGTSNYGALTGDDIRPAFPYVFPDPPVYRWSIPSGMKGRVIVEVTINPSGEVTAAKLLQGLTDEINEKVVQTVWKWRYRPATRNGMPIESRQDVSFYYPS